MGNHIGGVNNCRENIAKCVDIVWFRRMTKGAFCVPEWSDTSIFAPPISKVAGSLPVPRDQMNMRELVCAAHHRHE
jgi:hypothetical protein